MAFVFFRDNEDIDNGVVYSKKQKALIITLSIIPALIFITILTASHYGDIERDKICDSKEYILKREMLQHELEDIKRKNESLENIKKEVMPYLFQAPKDNRFGDK